MATISKSGILTGNTIQSEHITRIIDALDGTGTSSVIATGSFTGSFAGDGSQLTGVTAEWDGTHNGNGSITGSLTVTAGVTASLQGTSSWADNAITASFITLAQTASYVVTAQTASYVQTAQTASFINWNNIYTADAGKLFFVSPSGSDSNNGTSAIRPFQTLKYARDTATSGSTIIVQPGEYIFDNRASAGNPWNSKISDINLWKNGLTWHFMPGSIVKIYNSTVSGNRIYFFTPSGSATPSANAGGTVRVTGDLQYFQYGDGADSSNGHIYFFFDSDSTGNMYNFYADVNSLYTDTTEFVNITRNFTGSFTASYADIAIRGKSQYRTKSTNSGQSGAGANEIIFPATNATPINYISTFEQTYSDWGTPLYLRGDLSKCRINIKKQIFDYAATGSNSTTAILLRSLTTGSVVNLDIDSMYYRSSRDTFNYYGSVLSDLQCNGYIVNYRGNIIDREPNNFSAGIFEISSPNVSLNFIGNIYTNYSGSGNSNNGNQRGTGNGRFIASIANIYSTTVSSSINIIGNIHYTGVSTTTRPAFFCANGSNAVTFTGNIYGNFAGAIANPYSGGTVVLSSCNVVSNVTSSTALVYQNSGTTLSTVKINDSYIQMVNSGSGIGNGNYLNILINGSTIINPSGSGLESTIASGRLQILNSTIFNATGSSISSTNRSVISNNTTVNTNTNIASGYLTGSISVLTDLIY